MADKEDLRSVRVSSSRIGESSLIEVNPTDTIAEVFVSYVAEWRIRQWRNRQDMVWMEES